ncbi:MAG: hypothetical protein N2749_03030 [Clostridia bacterium]|nr:hypothetical protein [Clostridia bacterium]
MNNKDLNELLTYELRKILKIYVGEFESYIKKEKLRLLKQDAFVDNVIQFSDSRMGVWCEDESYIVYSNEIPAFLNDVVFDSKVYGTDPNIVFVSDDEFVENERDYLDYIRYAILKGMKTEDFYLSALPHEAMHLIGIGGGIKCEGITEHRTRQTCKKYGIDFCAPAGHFKEAKLARLMEKITGEDHLTKIGFDPRGYEYAMFIRNVNMLRGPGVFEKVYSNLNNQYLDTYIRTSYPNNIDRFLAYRELDFSTIYKLISQDI